MPPPPGSVFPWPLGPGFCLQAIRAVGVYFLQVFALVEVVLFCLSFFCFSLSLLGASRGFGCWFEEIDGCWRMAGGDGVQSQIC
jgi:hypothetical protein